MTLQVLLGTSYYDSHRGGIEIVAGRLARELGRAGVAVTWIASDATPAPAAGAFSGAPRPIASWNLLEQRIGVPIPVPGPAGLATIWHEVKAADVVHLHDCLYLTNIMAMLAARWHRKPVVLTQHIAAVPYASRLLRGIMAAANRLVTRPMLGAADQVVFISETVRAHFAGVPYKLPSRLVFNGVDTAVFRLPPADFDRAAARRSLGLPGEGALVCFVGRFVEKKGLRFIEALARRRPDLRFALAGWGPIDPAAWQLANVHVLTGLQGASLVPLYQASDALILPSVGEGLPLVMQEALACGLPVICGAETLAADPGARGFLQAVAVDGREAGQVAADLSGCLDGLLAETAMSQRPVAAAARNAYVQARYSWESAASAYLSILTGLVRPSAVAPVATAPVLPQESQRP